MRTNKKQLISQRRIIQQKMDRFAKLNEPMPPSGWVKAIRGSLGLSIRQLAARVGVWHGSINQLEKRETKRRVTLESLDQAARAMDCKLIYAIVPQKSENTLDDIIDAHAKEAAARILRGVAHTMRLEAQGTSEKEISREIERIAQELKESVDPRIWTPESKRKGGN
jgi:predicted DNA-binding mobile mystery protein A